MKKRKDAILRQIYRIPLLTRVLREVIRAGGKGIFHLLCRVRIQGRENVPQKGPYLVVFNHVSTYDPPVVVAFWPTQLEILGAVEVWSRKGQSLLARLWGGIPIHRGEVQRQAMEKTLDVLRSDLPLMISPEGGRSHAPGLRQAKTGVVYLAETTQVPIVPVGLIGTTDDFFQQILAGKRPEIEMKIGYPFTLPAADDSQNLPPKENRQKKADFIMKRIAELLPVPYRGYYV
jgi:1-acyl-sn-glycerol-3-phosphate acyltransferase